MRTKLVVQIGGILFFLAMGVAFTFYSNSVREYYYRKYEKLAQKTEFTKPWIEGYPLPYVFFMSGIIFFAISIFLIYLLVKELWL